MSIFTLSYLANSPFITILILIGLFYLAQKSFYLAGINWLELRARYQSQTIDYQKQQLALAMPKGNLIEWANWYVAHQHDIEIEMLPDGIEK